jgi:integrase
MPILDFQGLNFVVTYSIDLIPSYYTNLNLICTTLLNTGVRPEELLSFDRWSVRNNNFTILSTLKGNNPRTFDNSILGNDWINTIQYNPNNLSVGMIRQFNYQWSKVVTIPNLYVKDKPIGLYIFRHHYIKQLAYDGVPVDEIKLITGHKTTAVVEEYIYSDIYY